MLEILIWIFILIAAIVIMCITSSLTVRIIREKGCDTSLWGAFGFFFGGFAVIAAACMKDKKSPQDVLLVSEDQYAAKKAQEQEQKERIARQNLDKIHKQNVVCPDCDRMFTVEAGTVTVECPYCGKRLKRKTTDSDRF